MGPPSEQELRRLYEDTSTIAVVGASGDRLKPGSFVARYLKAYGFRIAPVNPGKDELFGERCHPTVPDIGGGVDVVQVFRPPAEAPGLVKDAVEVGARCLWLQLGLRSGEAAALAREAGLLYVEDNCMGVVHGRLGLGAGLDLGDEWHRGLDPVVLRGDVEVPVLRVSSGPDKGKAIPLEREVELGSTVGEPGRLPGDDQIAGRHARVRRTEHDLILLEDLDSENGLFVNGARVPAQALSIGDMIQIGFTTLDVVAAPKAGPPES